MKLRKKRLSGKEKGFTLVEILVVICIMAFLAAIAVPSFKHFIGKGEKESALTEMHYLQTAMDSMMIDKGITSVATIDTPTQDMTEFPPGNPLYGGGINYISKTRTHYYYVVAASGEVSGYTDPLGDNPIGS